jgi:medium-chain acyl-[acyl-carrier-protein] hydrolase
LGTQWVVIPRPNPKAAIRLICVPHAGGGVSSFRGWSERLGIAEVGIVELPGRGSRLREPVVESVTAAADGLVEALSGGPAVPSALFGHGLGALIAFEAARRLEARSWPMLALFVSGRRAPSLPASGPGLTRVPLEQLVEQAQRRSDVIPLDAALDRDSIRLLIPGVRADFAMLDGYGYQPGRPLRCPIVAYGAASDPDASRNDQTAWRAETSARFNLHVFGGDASYLQRERDAVTALIANQLSVMVSALARWSVVR